MPQLIITSVRNLCISSKIGHNPPPTTPATSFEMEGISGIPRDCVLAAEVDISVHLWLLHSLKAGSGDLCGSRTRSRTTCQAQSLASNTSSTKQAVSGISIEAEVWRRQVYNLSIL
ncbi:Uncharacterized protein Rs2_47541 [Raphanus sativus]|nr:Uncharacterized protein Rs2_47541 [Raphanus sativus]